MASLWSCHNPSLTYKDKLARRTPTNDSPTFTLAAFWAQIFASIEALTLAQIPVFASALGLPFIYTDVNLQKATKLASKLFV